MQKKSSGKRITFETFLQLEQDNIDRKANQTLANLLKNQQLTIAVIESITGGGIARKLIEVSGSSDYFLGGIIAYHPRLKVQYGMVSPATIQAAGVVSARVAEEMAMGLKRSTKADVVIASTGLAEMPDLESSESPKGSVFLSWNICDKIRKTKQYKLEGTRNSIIEKTVFIAISMCCQYLKRSERN